MRRLAAILNPQSDRGRTARLAERLRREAAGRIELRLLETTRRGEAVELARQAAGDFEGVIAIGGDGTMHEVANGLMAIPTDVRPTMGVIPAGSGNDFAFTLGIGCDLRRSIDALEWGTTRAVDVGEARPGEGAVRYCVNNIGALLEGQINLASHRLQWPRGSGLYLRAIIETLARRPRAARLEIIRDGASYSRDAIILSIGNGPRSGGRFFLNPEATVDDGQFDYILAEPVSRGRLLWKVAASMRGSSWHDRRVERGKFADMSIRSDMALSVHIDGEPWITEADDLRELSIKVLPGALRVFVG